MAEKSSKRTQQSPKPAKKIRKTETPATVEPSNKRTGLTIVGIGASAGGLAALGMFFDSIPADTGMAFVVVTHLHPEHESHMAELLQRHTHMPTMQVNKRIKMEPDHVYVIPPNRTIVVADTHLETQEFDEPHGRRTPIDHFFRSMAASGNLDPIAVILSGGGTDGAVGIKDIKEAGGVILVQDPTDAEYDSMPRAAMTTGLVGVVLPAGLLASKLVEYVKQRPVLPHDPGQLTDEETETLQRILAQVHARTGHDFSQYKRSTILRRVERRMQLNGFTTLDAYLSYLRSNAVEAQSMFNDILIGVTNFFRDREAWDTLRKNVIPELFKSAAGALPRAQHLEPDHHRPGRAQFDAGSGRATLRQDRMLLFQPADAGARRVRGNAADLHRQAGPRQGHPPHHPFVRILQHRRPARDAQDDVRDRPRGAGERPRQQPGREEDVGALGNAQRVEHEVHRKVHRPWGWYDSIDQGDRFQVKRIMVKPGASLSLQKHHHRAEHWIVVTGTAEVTVGDQVILLAENQSTYIPLGATHRLRNPGKVPLEIIEVQSGSYLGEDEIVRYEDTYGRS